MRITFKPGALEKIMQANARNRSGWQRLEEIAKKYDVKGNRVLDIGIHGDVWPGGHKYMFKEASYETLDIDPQVQPTHVGDIRDTEFEDGSFDMIIFHSVLEHILEDRDKVYPEIKRILKPGGTIAVFVPSTLERESEPAKIVTWKELREGFDDTAIQRLEDGNYFVEYVK